MLTDWLGVAASDTRLQNGSDSLSEVCTFDCKLRSVDQYGTMASFSVEHRKFNDHPMEVETSHLASLQRHCEFSNQDKVIECAISTAAMDDLEGQRGVKADQRVDQFMRLREVIEDQASRKFFGEQVRVDRPVVLRSNDFSIVASLRPPSRT